MDKQAVIAVLLAHREELEKRGVRHAALFGSVARGDAGPQSDIDIAIDVDPELIQTIYDYAGLKRIVAELFTRPVDVIDRQFLRPEVRDRVVADLVYAF